MHRNRIAVGIHKSIVINGSAVQNGRSVLRNGLSPASAILPHKIRNLAAFKLLFRFLLGRVFVNLTVGHHIIAVFRLRIFAIHCRTDNTACCFLTAYRSHAITMRNLVLACADNTACTDISVNFSHVKTMGNNSCARADNTARTDSSVDRSRVFAFVNRFAVRANPDDAACRAHRISAEIFSGIIVRLVIILLFNGTCSRNGSGSIRAIADLSDAPPIRFMIFPNDAANDRRSRNPSAINMAIFHNAVILTNDATNHGISLNRPVDDAAVDDLSLIKPDNRPHGGIPNHERIFQRQIFNNPARPSKQAGVL